MHEFRRLIEDEMDRKGWTQADLSRASGLSPQHVSNLVHDDRDQIPDMPGRQTMQALADAFTISMDRVLIAAAAAYGVPVDKPLVVPTVEGLPDSTLARALLQRAEQREAGVSHGRESAPMIEEAPERRLRAAQSKDVHEPRRPPRKGPRRG